MKEITAPLAVSAVLFDLDGTLLDTLPDLHAAVSAMLRDLGRPALPEAATRSYVGRGMPNLVKRVLANSLDAADDATAAPAEALASGPPAEAVVDPPTPPSAPVAMSLAPPTIDAVAAEDFDAAGFAPPDAVAAGEPPPDEHEEGAPAPMRVPVQALAVREAVGIPVSARDPDPMPAPEVLAVKVREAAAELAPARCVLAEVATPPSSAEGDFWHALVQELVAREAVTALVRELALQSQLVARHDGRWTLRVENESLGQSAARDRLQAALADAGHAVRLQVEIGTVADSPARRNRIAADQRLKAAEALLAADPFVQEMMRDFGAKIVPGSIKPL